MSCSGSLLTATTFQKSGTYGSAVLDISANTLTYTLENARPATNALTTAAEKKITTDRPIRPDHTFGEHCGQAAEESKGGAGRIWPLPPGWTH